MITYYKNTEHGLEIMDEPVQNCWINVVAPTIDEIDTLTRLSVPKDFITYPLDVDETARIEREDDGEVLVLVRIPSFKGLEEDIPYTTIPLGVILTENFIMTVCRQENEIMQNFTMMRRKVLSTGKRSRFLLRILLHAASRYLIYLREINKQVDLLEDQLQQTMRNHELLQILKYQKSLVYFTTALKANELVLERLQRGRLVRMYPDDEDLLEDVITENRQAMEMASISSNILVSMMDTFASMISNNLNVVMRFLASVTIVLSLPTLVTSYFGMNVGLPFQQDPYAYLVILGICMVTALLFVSIFLRRGWF